jgi:hypothetical protein
VCELRRAHPRWGALRIVHELMRGPASAEGLPSRATVHRILVRHGLVITRSRRRKPTDYVRWQRPAAMQLWQLDIVYGPRLVDTVTGELREARIVTGVDDHSRFCVMARVVERATGRAICLSGALPQACVLIAGIPFNATLWFFGANELMGHLPIYGAMLALLVYGSDPQLRPTVSALVPPGFWGRRRSVAHSAATA